MITALLIASVVLIGTVTLVSALTANLYDLRLMKRFRQQQLQPYARRYRQRPSLTVIVPTHNNAASIEHCLSALLAAKYRKLEILVVDMKSDDNTRQIVRQYSKQHRKHTVRLIAKRKLNLTAQDLGTAYRQYGHGEFIWICQPTDIVMPDTLHAAIAHANRWPELTAIMLRTVPRSAPTLLGLLQAYRSLLTHRQQKGRSLFSSQPPTSSATLYRRQIWKALHIKTAQLPELRWGYAPDAIVQQIPIRHWYQLWLKPRTLTPVLHPSEQQLGYLLRMSRWALSSAQVLANLALVCLPVTLGYFTYLALRLHEPRLFIISLLAAAILLLVTIWSDEELHLSQKLRYSFGIPLTYGLFFLAACGQALTLFVQLAWAALTRLFASFAWLVSLSGLTPSDAS